MTPELSAKLFFQKLALQAGLSKAKFGSQFGNHAGVHMDLYTFNPNLNQETTLLEDQDIASRTEVMSKVGQEQIKLQFQRGQNALAVLNVWPNHSS